MIKEEDWGRIYYAVIRKYDISKDINILGIGSTIFSAKRSAIDFISLIKNNMPTAISSYADAIMSSDHNTYVRPYSTGSKFKIGIVYCEAKIKIYAERFGLDGMIVALDPTYYDDLLRFAGYDSKERSRLYDKRRKLEL